MKKLLVLMAMLTPMTALAAAVPQALGPNAGKFGDWTAATLGSGPAKICYAFTSASASKPVIAKRGPVMLTVTERAGARDEVTLNAGYKYPANAKVSLSVGTAVIDFYTQSETAFTTGGADAVAAFKVGAAAQAVSTGPHGHDVTDDFSLTGFSGAYAAITAACP
ncbi:MAG: invasion associated locus B family protein [Acidocella sp.]|nr:invasion associated locus B family protein [Acidocella sp.]